MKVHDPNLSSSSQTSGTSLGQTSGVSRAQRTSKTGGTGLGNSISNGQSGGDDLHLSELVRSLRSLAADSPQRQEHLEKIARSYAAGTYQVNAQGTASNIIDDALQS
jgi:hypothetical protein